ncbi:type IIL restriction-modification enzyme MmeI [Streptomyces sp. NPDC018352]|uniref:Eco57I restriction-modification methylase domain-containing protein n=1 Tax=Streptomyces sp. NPDC018352 TaxID=3157194 RepID=UPI00340073B5
MGSTDGTGFDAVVGNPPFSGGQKITGNLGTDYREYLINRLGGGTRGSADLCAYFLLRNLALAPRRRAGIIATNTIAQGKTREVGLDQATAAGWTVYRATKSQRWPGTANLEVALLWMGGLMGEDEQPVLDGAEVRGITPGLDPQSRVSGKPYRLAANAGQSFIGSYVLGKGFVLQPEVAQALIEKDPRNRDVLFPYLNGEDLNSRADCSASRWVINFHGWSEEKAATYEDVFAIAERDVKPARASNKRPAHRDRWWQYAERAPKLYEAIADLERVIAVGQTSSTQMPALVKNQSVFDQKLVVFPTDSYAHLALLSSEIHYWWTVKQGSTRTADLVHTPSTCCETLPMPALNDNLNSLGSELAACRSKLAMALTPMSQMLHSRDASHPALKALRDTHVRLEREVVDAYGWTDLDLRHGFHTTPRGPRFTIAPAVQTKILDRLLELNHARYGKEQAAGLHVPGAKKKAALKRAPKTEPKPEDGIQDGIF